MTRKLVYVLSVFFFCMTAGQFAFAEDAAELITAQAPSAYETLWAQAKEFQSQGKIEEAKVQYAKAVAEAGIPLDIQQKIQGEYEDLKLKAILSGKGEDSQSETYTVVSGDSLFKIAKKKKTTIELIKKMNGLKSDTIFIGAKLKLIQGDFRILVDKSENVLTLFLGEDLIKRYRVSTGENNNTPIGEFSIINKLENPTWYNAGTAVPPDSPKNILGTRWMGFDLKSYGIHGTTLPETIGTQASMGCIRMLNQEVEELYSMIPLGTKVTVQN